MSSSDLKKNKQNNINNIKQKNKELNMNFINSNYNYNKNDKNKNIKGSLSNPNREKINYKLKNNSGLTSSMIIKKNTKTKREISALYNSNNNLHKKHNNYIQLRQFNGDSQNDFNFHLPNLNKNSSIVNLYGFKKKPKLNLNQLKIKLNINYNIKNDFMNNNNKNKYLLSPKTRRLKKSESTTLIKSTKNSSNNNLNNYKKIGNFNNMLSPPNLRRNYSNFSNNITANRNGNSARKKRYKDISGF